MSHLAYVSIAYGATALALVALIVWVLVEQRVRRAELDALEAQGVRRRSAAGESGHDR